MMPWMTGRGKSCLPVTAALMVALISGCVSAPPDAGFSEVVDTTAERTGFAAAWTRGAEEDAAVQRMVADLLQGELMLEEAVQIGLLSNRNLQALYEDLGISRAQLIQAGLPQNPVFAGEWRFFDAGTAFESVIVQEFISVITIPLRRDIEGNEFEATKRRVTSEVVALIADIKRGYIDYQAAKQTVQMLRHVVQSTKAGYMTMERLREAGNKRQVDVLQERALYEQAKVDLNAATEHLVISRERLNALMGLWGPAVAWETPARLPELPQSTATASSGAQRGEPAPPLAPRAMAAEGLPGIHGPDDTPEEFRAERLAGPPTDAQITAPKRDVLGSIDAEYWLHTEEESLSTQIEPDTRRFEIVERLAVKRNLLLAAQWDLVQAQAATVKHETLTAIFPFLNAGATLERTPAGEWGEGPAVETPVPLFDFGQAAYPREASLLRQRLERYAALATNIRAIARTAEARHQTTKARAMYHRDVIMPLQAALVEEAQLQYNAMQFTPFQLLQNKRMQIAAALAYIAAVQDYWHARTDLEQLLDGSLPHGTLPMGAAAPLPAIPAAMQMHNR